MAHRGRNAFVEDGMTINEVSHGYVWPEENDSEDTTARSDDDVVQDCATQVSALYISVKSSVINIFVVISMRMVRMA